MREKKKLATKYTDAELHPIKLTLPISRKMHDQIIEHVQTLVKKGIKLPPRKQVNFVIREFIKQGLSL
jgi:hypothetical protein